nr:PREDICTED: piggyBac transposable element-derived protein 3-like [Tribolium castaneum]|eukprot:XP_015839963.1 PREDICTED: piggyBac transposable element-derived protein 3-like [Tribolium castaneum]
MGGYQDWSRWKKPLTLNEEEVENLEDETVIPDEIIFFPPENANECNIDKDSGEEDNVVLNNLPGSQLRGNVEVVLNHQDEEINDEIENWDSEDEIHLSLVAQKKFKKFKNFHFTIGVDLQDHFPKWNQVYITKNNLSPAETFKLFFDENLMKDLVGFSNQYALQKNRPGDITTDDMFCFFAILMLSGYCSVSRKKMYWQNSDDTNNELVSSSISRDLFQHVMSNFHCVDNNNLNKSDRFAKVRPLFLLLNQKFLDHAPTEENHSVDEAMVPYFGRHGCKQFIRGKPIRWGYKFWVGATRLGYIVYFKPYQGSSTNLPEKYKDLGLGATVVL